MPPVALYLLTAVLREYNHDVTPIDPLTIKKYLNNDKDSFNNFIAEFVDDADVICLSANTLNWPMTKLAIAAIKTLADKPIILGGIHPSYFAEYILKTTQVDFILKGESEFTLPKLLDSIKANDNYHGITGLVWKNKLGNIQINEDSKPLQTNDFMKIPIPAYDAMPSNTYTSLPIESSRGCRYGCRFCSVPRKHNWACFDTEWAIERISTTVTQFGSKFKSTEIYITDDCFTTDSDRATKILDSLINQKSDINILIEARVNDIRKSENEPLLEQLSRRQVCRIATGVECGYNDGLKMVKKGLTIEQLEEFHKKMVFYDIINKTYYTFIFAFPWETIDECQKTIDYAATVEERFGPGRVNINWLMLMPSQIWDERQKYGYMLEEDIFDSTDCYFVQDWFYKTHPNISPSIAAYLDKHIKKYEDSNIILRNP
jgi:radical SAM superfamily enzyme YgiQ (UPF0313 family)